MLGAGLLVVPAQLWPHTLALVQLLTPTINQRLPTTRCHPPPAATRQVAESKHEIERLQREMNEVKKKYFEQRREAREAAASGAKPAGPAALPAKAAPSAAALGGAGASDLIPAARPAGMGSPAALPTGGPGSTKASPAVSVLAV